MSGEEEWVRVPKEPTMAMISEGFEAIRMEVKWPECIDRIYRAMLSVSPSQVASGEEEVARLREALKKIAGEPRSGGETCWDGTRWRPIREVAREALSPSPVVDGSSVARAEVAASTGVKSDSDGGH